MFDEDLIQGIADDLDANGQSLVLDSEHRRLLVTTLAHLGYSTSDVILAYEGRGTIFFKIDRPMNHFRLMTSGFPEKVARPLSDMINRLVSILAERRRVEATTVALEGNKHV